MTTVAATEPVYSRLWREHVLALAAVILLIGVEFHDALAAALQVWVISPTYSHCFLVIPIVAWLIWEKRDALAAVRPAVAPIFLWFVPILLLVWWLGELSAINEMRQYAVVALMQVMIITFLGVDVARLIWFPILFLLFMVPTGEYLIFPMQHFATRFVDICLSLLNIPHYTEGTTFELTNGRFEIAEACAGLRFLVATVTLGVLFSYMVYRKIYKVAIFLVASVVVPLIGNGLRCVGIILIAHFTNNEYGVGADHIVYGWGFNVAILLILIFLGSLFRDDIDDPIISARANKPRASGLKAATVMAIAAVLVSVAPAYAWWHDTKAAETHVSGIVDNLHNNGWHEDATPSNWAPYFPDTDAHISMALHDEMQGPAVNLFVGYYSRPRAGHSVTAHINLAWDEKTWNASGSDVITSSLDGQKVQLQEVLINSGSERRLVWSTYWVDSRFAISTLTVKLLQAEASFEGREGQAFIALSTQVDGSLDEARARLAMGASHLTLLSQVLDRANMVAKPTRDGAQ